MQQADDERLTALFHTYTTSFLPQTIFFLAQHTAVANQGTYEQLTQQFNIWNSILQLEYEGEMSVQLMLH
jgi:hypothetical protein